MPGSTAFSVVPLFFGLLLAPLPGSLAFQCGNDLKTYSVRSLGGVQGTGIRCVKMMNAGMSGAYPYFAWYGEGTWGQDVKYRHVGHVFATALGLVGSSSEIFGNGETSNLTFDASLFFVLVDSSIRVRGAWNEQWDLVDDAPYNAITYPIFTCGPNLKMFPLNGGIICFMQNADPLTTWFGTKVDPPVEWRNIGTRFRGQEYDEWVVNDLCPFGNCNTFSLKWILDCDGGLTFLHTTVGSYIPL